MRQRYNKDTAEQSTPQFNNAKPTNTNSTLHKKIIFKDAVTLLSHSLFRILLHQIAPDIIWSSSNSTGRKVTSNHILKYSFLPYSSQRTITT